MTRNEQIAKKMRWILLDPEYNGLDMFNTDDAPGSLNLWDMKCAKLLQQRMVDDGYRIVIEHDDDGITATALHPGQHENWPQSENIETETAALVDLFCKVYGIGGDYEPL